MKIGFFTDRYFPQVDGVAVSVKLFADELEKLGHQVYIFCPESTEKVPRESKDVVRFTSFPSIWYEDHRDSIPFTPSIINQVRDYKLDIIHVHTPAFIGFLGMRIGKLDNIPIVSTYHTDIEQYTKAYPRLMAGLWAGVLLGPALIKNPDIYKETLSSLIPKFPLKKWNQKIIQEGISAMYSNCQLIVVPSEKMKRVIESYRIPTRYLVLPTGINTHEMSSKSHANIRKQYAISESDKVVLFVGRLGIEKNIQLLIKSFAKVIKTHPNTKLLVVGDGPYRAVLEQLSEDIGCAQSIIFTGMLPRSDVFACYRTANVFAFTSLTDTQGLVLNEACYLGLPVVYCDDRISPLTLHGETGLLAKPTITSVASNISKLLNNPALAKQYGEAGRLLAKTITMPKQTRKLLRGYSTLLRSSKN